MVRGDLAFEAARSAIHSALPAKETFKKIFRVTLPLKSYTMKFHYRTISGYRELPPKWRILAEERDYRSPTDRYLDQIDASLREARDRVPAGGTGEAGDIVSLVFGNQSITHELTSRQLAHLIEERRAITQRHLRDVQSRLEELRERKPFRRQGPFFPDDATLTEVERQILNLEMQKRTLELDLWRDTHELRTNLVNERREQETARRRISYLAGGSYG